MASAMDGTPALMPLSCATANLKGSGVKAPKTRKKPSYVRFGLIRDCLEANEVLFLQEVTCKKLILKHLSDIHHIVIPDTDVGILLSKASFDVEKQLSGASLQRDIDRLNTRLDTKLESGRLICVSSIHRATGLRFLFVSYHGRNSLTFKEKACLCETLIVLCEMLKEREKADYFVVGGDFNFTITNFVKDVLPKFNKNGLDKYQAFDFITKPRVQKGTRKDYIVCDSAVQVSKVQRYEFKEIENLKVYFDHDPVEAKLKIPYHAPYQAPYHDNRSNEQEATLEVTPMETSQEEEDADFNCDFFSLQIKELAHMDPSVAKEVRKLIKKHCHELTEKVATHIINNDDNAGQCGHQKEIANRKTDLNDKKGEQNPALVKKRTQEQETCNTQQPAAQTTPQQKKQRRTSFGNEEAQALPFARYHLRRNQERHETENDTARSNPLTTVSSASLSNNVASMQSSRASNENRREKSKAQKPPTDWGLIANWFTRNPHN